MGGTCCYTPTCANTDGANTKFDCAANGVGTATDVYKTAAASSTSPAVGVCCMEPTCSNIDGSDKKFDCVADTTSKTDKYKTGAAAKTTVNVATCCEEDGTATK